MDFKERDERILQISDLIDQMPTADKIKIAHHLNLYEWLDILPGKPEGWEAMSHEERCEWIDPIYRYIERRVSTKALSRYWHINELGRSEQEFNDWWDSLPELRKISIYDRREILDELKYYCKNSDDDRDASYYKACKCCIAVELILFAAMLVLFGFMLSGFCF